MKRAGEISTGPIAAIAMVPGLWSRQLGSAHREGSGATGTLLAGDAHQTRWSGARALGSWGLGRAFQRLDFEIRNVTCQICSNNCQKNSRICMDPKIWSTSQLQIHQAQPPPHQAPEPPNQDLTAVKSLLRWLDLAPLENVARVLETGLFPQWHSALKRWLRTEAWQGEGILAGIHWDAGEILGWMEMMETWWFQVSFFGQSNSFDWWSSNLPVFLGDIKLCLSVTSPEEEADKIICAMVKTRVAFSYWGMVINAFS